MKKTLVFLFSVICLYQNLYTHEITPFYDLGIVYKNNPNEKVKASPLYTWLSAVQRVSRIAIFNTCTNTLLDAADVAAVADEYDRTITSITSKIFRLCKSLPPLSVTCGLYYEKLWRTFASVLTVKTDVNIQSIKNKKNMMAYILLRCFPTPMVRSAFSYEVFLCLVVYVLLSRFLFKGLSNYPLHGVIDHCIYLYNMVTMLLVMKTYEFKDVDQALDNKQKVLAALEVAKTKFLNNKK